MKTEYVKLNKIRFFLFTNNLDAVKISVLFQIHKALFKSVIQIFSSTKYLLFKAIQLHFLINSVTE